MVSACSFAAVDGIPSQIEIVARLRLVIDEIMKLIQQFTGIKEKKMNIDTFGIIIMREGMKEV